ncbi:MAG: TPM domain-containing protein [Candidatus Thalassarchaeaceae archaeon]|nr:hypothetical protein [Euryarchaeota archaeon]MDP6871196.1 TPM domain-containing protein [Candidatus Thalassarchaeaceae archaeon]
MRHVIISSIVVILLSSSVAGEHVGWSGHFPPQPEGEWYVYDVAGVISNETEAEFEEELIRIHEEYGVLVRLVTIGDMWDYGLGPSNGIDEDFFSDDEGYARQMFQHYGMEGGEEPSMMIALSTGDRQFKFVMPDMPALNQRISGDVFINGAWRLGDAADHYEGWWGSDGVYSGYDNCEWGPPTDQWWDGSDRFEMWTCWIDDSYEEWGSTWAYCEDRGGEWQWYCYDHPWVVEEDWSHPYGYVGGGPENANGTLLDINGEYTRGNLWEIALSKYVHRVDDIVEPEPWHWSVHSGVYSIGLLSMVFLVSRMRKERTFDQEFWERKEWAEERLGFAYSRRRGMLSLKSLKGEPDGTVFEKVSDQIEELTKVVTGELREIEYDRDLLKSCAELNKRADDVGIPEDVQLIDMDLEEEFRTIQEFGDSRDRINSVLMICLVPIYFTLIYLGLSMVAYHPFTLGDWVLDDPWLVIYIGNGLALGIVIISTIVLYLLYGFTVWSVSDLVREYAGVRSPLFPLYRPQPTARVVDYSNVIIPVAVGSYLIDDVVAGGYVVTSAGFDEHGNEIYESSRPVSSSSDGGGGCGGGGCGGGGCGGGGCGGGGGF